MVWIFNFLNFQSDRRYNVHSGILIILKTGNKRERGGRDKLEGWD